MSDTIPADHPSPQPFTVSRTAPPCPRCGGPLQRIPRLWVDRLRSLVTPVRRYRCDWLGCHWSGHLRADGSVPGSDKGTGKDAGKGSGVKR